jgi:hypothetical protein
LERWLLHASLALQIIALLTPMRRDGDRVAVTFDLNEELGVGGWDVDPIDDFGLLHKALEFGDGETVELALFALRELGDLLVVVLRRHLVVRVDDLAFAINAFLEVLLLHRIPGVKWPSSLRQREARTSSSTGGAWKWANTSAKSALTCTSSTTYSAPLEPISTSSTLTAGDSEATAWHKQRGSVLSWLDFEVGMGRNGDWRVQRG